MGPAAVMSMWRQGHRARKPLKPCQAFVPPPQILWVETDDGRHSALFYRQSYPKSHHFHPLAIPQTSSSALQQQNIVPAPFTCQFQETWSRNPAQMHPGINQALKTHLAAFIIPEQGDRIYVLFGSFLLEHSDESMQVATVPPCSPFRSWPQVKPTRLWQVSQKSCKQSLLDIQPLILAETVVATKIHTATSMRYCK